MCKVCPANQIPSSTKKLMAIKIQCKSWGRNVYITHVHRGRNILDLIGVLVKPATKLRYLALQNIVNLCCKSILDFCWPVLSLLLALVLDLLR